MQKNHLFLQFNNFDSIWSDTYRTKKAIMTPNSDSAKRKPAFIKTGVFGFIIPTTKIIIAVNAAKRTEFSNCNNLQIMAEVKTMGRANHTSGENNNKKMEATIDPISDPIILTLPAR